MKKCITGLFVTVLTLVLSCDDEDKARFEGILLRSPDNMDLGTKGSRDLNDWQNDGTLSNDILELLAFDTEDITGTETSTVIGISGYPNPAKYSNYITFSLSHNSRVRLVVVNESMKVLDQAAFSGSNIFNLELADRKKFPNGKIVRVYYSISSEADPNFYVGHGDVLVCDNIDSCL